MKIKHSDLEKFKINPKAFINPVKDEIKMRYSYATALNNAIYHLHKNGRNILDAHEYLQATCDRNFTNEVKIGKVHDDLDKYYRSFMSLNSNTICTQHRMNYNIFDDLIIAGEISRIDTNPFSTNYIAYLFMKNTPNWNSQFRMPILQYCLSKELGCHIEEIEIGIYDLANYNHKSICFSDDIVESTLDEMKYLYRSIN